MLTYWIHWWSSAASSCDRLRSAHRGKVSSILVSTEVSIFTDVKIALILQDWSMHEIRYSLKYILRIFLHQFLLGELQMISTKFPRTAAWEMTTRCLKGKGARDLWHWKEKIWFHCSEKFGFNMQRRARSLLDARYRNDQNLQEFQVGKEYSISLKLSDRTRDAHYRWLATAQKPCRI